LLILSFLLGIGPLPSTVLDAQTGKKASPARKKGTTKKKRPAQKTAKKKRTAKKPGKAKAKRRPSSKKKKGQARRPAKKARSKAARKGRPVRKKRPPRKARPEAARKPAREKAPAPIPAEKISIVDFSNELYDLTETLNTSTRQLARAINYLEPKESKRVVKIESRPVFTTKDLEAMAARDPDNVHLRRQLGLHYESLHDWENAKDVYLRLLAKDPLNPDFHYYLGMLYYKMNELDKARQAFEEALDLQPDHKATLDALATFTGTPAQEEMSEGVLLRSTRQSPEGPVQQVALIRQQIREGHYREAVRLAEEAETKYPDHSGFIYLRGVALEEMGKTDEAKRAYQQAIKRDPNNREAHLALADLYYSQGKYIYAALAYSDVVYLDPRDVETRYMQGLCYFNAHEWGRAAAAWEDLLHYEPNHPLVRTLLPQTYYILAVEYNRLGQSVLGRTAFKKALSVNQDSHRWLPGALRTLGKYYREKGMFKESLAALQESIELRTWRWG
jgi:tetratricopeptide (TPR) repeat protein